MLPNRFPDHGEQPEYNTVDATLWYFEAIRAYHAATGDDGLLRELFPVLEEIVAWHQRGTRYHIHVDPEDGLLYAGVERRAVDLDGCQSGGLGGHASDRQTGGDQCSLVQRHADDGRLCRQAWPTAGAIHGAGQPGAARFRPLLESGG